MTTTNATIVEACAEVMRFVAKGGERYRSLSRLTRRMPDDDLFDPEVLSPYVVLHARRIARYGRWALARGQTGGPGNLCIALDALDALLRRASVVMPDPPQRAAAKEPVLPSEHRSSQVARRYYRRSWNDGA